MSWFYEALQRAEVENSKPRKASRPGLPRQEKDFLMEIEELSSFSIEGTSKIDQAAEQATDGRTACSSQAAEVAIQVSPEIQQSHNGYRHWELPFRGDSRLVFHTDAFGLAAEQFRLLRRKLIHRFGDGGVLIVTSPTQGDGKTLTSINLCSCLAETGDPTLLFEADMRKPTLAKVLSCPLQGPAMEDVLAGVAQPSEAIHRIEQLHFHAAMFGRAPQDASKFVNGRRLRELLSWARNNFRWIVLDTPPVLPGADVADLMPQADAVLLVIRADGTPRELCKRAFEMLGKRLSGVILNSATVDSNPHYRYLSNYYSGTPAKHR